MELSNTERFSSRVENYVKFRPSYPQGVLSLLRDECGLSERSIVADIGSGTGILTELLLLSGATVYGVEPNAEMREAGERMLAGRDRFSSVNATAEDTTLEDSTVDIVTAGQAFHWFDWARAGQEFRRILRKDGWVALVWNERRPGGDAFLDGYEKLLRDYAPEYMETRHAAFDEVRLTRFFGEGRMQVAHFENSQTFDLEGLRGRFLSSSYAPEVGHALHDPAIHALDALFASTQDEGRVNFLYETQVYYGQL